MNEYKSPKYDINGNFSDIYCFVSSSAHCPTKALEVISNKYRSTQYIPAHLMFLIASNKNTSSSLLYNIHYEDTSSLAIRSLARNESIPAVILSDIVDKHCVQPSLFSNYLVQDILNNKSTPTYIRRKLIYNFNIIQK